MKESFYLLETLARLMLFVLDSRCVQPKCSGSMIGIKAKLAFSSAKSSHMLKGGVGFVDENKDTQAGFPSLFAMRCLPIHLLLVDFHGFY